MRGFICVERRTDPRSGSAPFVMMAEATDLRDGHDSAIGGAV